MLRSDVKRRAPNNSLAIILMISNENIVNTVMISNEFPIYKLFIKSESNSSKSRIVCIVAAIGSTQSADQCLNFPSGIQRMVRGIDVTKLDLSPQDLAQSNGFQRALVSLTCTQGKKWQHPFDPTLVFDIPDQVDTINTLPGGVLNTKATLIETTEDFKKSKGFDLGLDVNTVAYGAYGVSGSFKQAQEDLVNSTKSIVEVSAFVSAIRVDMSPYYEITPNQEFQDFV
ncbi:unnamed protein product, partial [Oppiella nova]